MRLILSLVTCIALAAIGCGGGDDASGRVQTDAPQIPLGGSGTATATQTTPQAGATAARVALRRIGSFASPTYLTAPPGDKRRLFVVEQAGTIREVRDGRKLAKPFLDIRSQVQAGGERGLLSMAFAPNYAKSHLYYVYYTGQDGDLHIVEYPTRRELVRLEHSTYPNHNGGQLQFGPDGRLYAGTGDGGGGGDPFRNAQNPNRLLGKILRFDAARRTPEVFAIGLRNPWRFAFDRANGDVTIADVGQDKYEEIDFVKAGHLRGKNFGWSMYEGLHTYYGGSAPPNYVKPVIERSHAGDGYCSITGGYIVRDRSVKALYGRYVYGDYCNPQLRWARLRAGRATSGGRLGLQVPALSSFGEDGRGRVYAVSQNGPVYRFTAR
ncbi:MAG TPA: PQQ-dependent sugar dehydrogenase [Thermoleophilaceae bacterium]|nr:PQQ-dependent sugar dehydrogenase [Thermoleophilaceae bacterium]